MVATHCCVPYNPCCAGGSSGWQAPEQLIARDGGTARQTRAMDVFSLGCVLFHCLTAGQHPFGENYERDTNILRGKPAMRALQVRYKCGLNARWMDPCCTRPHLTHPLAGPPGSAQPGGCNAGKSSGRPTQHACGPQPSHVVDCRAAPPIPCGCQ